MRSATRSIRIEVLVRTHLFKEAHRILTVRRHPIRHASGPLGVRNKRPETPAPPTGRVNPHLRKSICVGAGLRDRRQECEGIEEGFRRAFHAPSLPPTRNASRASTTGPSVLLLRWIKSLLRHLPIQRQDYLHCGKRGHIAKVCRSRANNSTRPQ